MSATINFIKNSLSNKTLEIKRRAPVAATLKYSIKANLPASEENNVLIYTDDAELFFGSGSGKLLKRLSDVITVSDVSELPDIGMLQKLYVSKADNTLYFWNGDEYQSLAGGDGGSVALTRIFEYASSASFPALGVEKSIYIAKDTDVLFRFDVTHNRYVQLSRTVSDPILATKITALENITSKKADMSDLASYRKTADKIAESDIAETFIDKVSLIETSVENKADKASLNAKADITALSNLATKQDLANKADLSSLNSYRKRADTISEQDLDTGVVSKLNALSIGYDDSEIKSGISALQNGKADKSEITTLADALEGKVGMPAIENIELSIAAIQTDLVKKADNNSLNDYRKTVEKIVDADLDQTLLDKINNSSGNPYDDTAIKDTIATKADSSVVSALSTQIDTKADKTLISDLQSALAAKANSTDLAISNNSIAVLQGQLADAIARILVLESGVSTPPLKNITSFSGISPIDAAYGTTFNSLLLPSKVTAVLNDGSTVDLVATWNKGNYDANTAASYTIKANTALLEGISNTNNIEPSIKVTVLPKAGESSYDWQYEFVLSGAGGTSVRLSEIPSWNPANKFTLEDFYGTNYDGADNTVEIQWIGYVGNRLHDPNGVPHPTSIEYTAGATKISPDGATDYDNETEIVSFAGASLGDRIYRIQKVSAV